MFWNEFSYKTQSCELEMITEEKIRKHIRKILKEEVVDITDIQDELLMMPFEARQKLRDDLADAVDMDTEEEYVEMDEQISYKGIPEIKAKTTVGKLIIFPSSLWHYASYKDESERIIISSNMKIIGNNYV